MGERRLENWIEGFVEWSNPIQSPVIYRRWAAASAVAAALERKVTCRIAGQDQFVNLYILLVGPPGSGKSNAVKLARQLIAKVGTINLSPKSLTRRAFLSALENSHNTTINVAENTSFDHSSLTALLDEWGVFVKEGDTELMTDLTDIYDNNPIFEHFTEHSGSNTINYPWFNMLGGVTMKGLRKRFADDALDEGFPARIVLVYAHKPAEHVPLGLDEDTQKQTSIISESMAGNLVMDLEKINVLRGQFRWQKEAAAEFQKWVNEGQPPGISDQRFEHYATRRITHLTKLSLVISAACSDRMWVSLEHFNAARDMLFEAEKWMPNALRGLGKNPYIDQMELVQKLVKNFHKRTGRGIPEPEVWSLLGKEMDPTRIRTVIETMLNSGTFQSTGDYPRRTLYPKGVALS